MQERPDKSVLLDAVAQLLLAEVQYAVADKRLAFRVLIAANLASIVSNELRTEDERATAELLRLQALLPGTLEGDPVQLPAGRRRQALGTMNHELSRRLRARRVSPEERVAIQVHLKQTLLETLAVVNPRFDTSPDIE
jgi:hypothetical protein